jgi:hypothetical protein
LRGAMLHELFPNDTTPATTDFACKECTVCAAGKALIAPATALIKTIVKKQRRIWSRCWAPPDMGLCGASMIWCEAMPWAPGGRVNSAVVCVASQRGAAPPVVPKNESKGLVRQLCPPLSMYIYTNKKRLCLPLSMYMYNPFHAWPADTSPICCCPPLPTDRPGLRRHRSCRSSFKGRPDRPSRCQGSSSVWRAQHQRTDRQARCYCCRSYWADGV